MKSRYLFDVDVGPFHILQTWNSQNYSNVTDRVQVEGSPYKGGQAQAKKDLSTKGRITKSPVSFKYMSNTCGE